MENIQEQVQEPTQNLDPQEVKLEEDDLNTPDEGDLRQETMEKYGLNELDHSELIESIVKDKLEDKKKISTAIRQKRSWREKALAPKEQKPEEKPQPVQQPQPLNEDLILQKVDEKLAQRELDSLELDDSLKQDVKNYALLNNVSLRDSLKSSYIQFRKNEIEEKQRIEEASIGSKHRTMAKKDFSDMSAKDFDMSTKEGRDAFAEYKEYLKAHAQ